MYTTHTARSRQVNCTVNNVNCTVYTSCFRPWLVGVRYCHIFKRCPSRYLRESQESTENALSVEWKQQEGHREHLDQDAETIWIGPASEKAELRCTIVVVRGCSYA